MTTSLHFPTRLLALGLLLWPSAAGAHPHVWIKVAATVLYDKGSIVGLKSEWTFDELFATDATQGLDANNDGVLDRAELADLAKENVEGMKELGYFTVARLGSETLAFQDPTDYWLDFNGKALTLHFTLPLATPVLAEAPGFAFTVADESYFIAFEIADDAAVTLGPGAPAGCKIAMVDPPEDEQALADAFGSGASDTLPADTATTTAFASRSVSVSCPR